MVFSMNFRWIVRIMNWLSWLSLFIGYSSIVIYHYLFSNSKNIYKTFPGNFKSVISFTQTKVQLRNLNMYLNIQKIIIFPQVSPLLFLGNFFLLCNGSFVVEIFLSYSLTAAKLLCQVKNEICILQDSYLLNMRWFI